MSKGAEHISMGQASDWKGKVAKIVATDFFLNHTAINHCCSSFFASGIHI